MEYVKVRAAEDEEATDKPQNVWILDSQPGTVGPDVMPDVTRVLQAVQVWYPLLGALRPVPLGVDVILDWIFLFGTTPMCVPCCPT